MLGCSSSHILKLKISIIHVKVLVLWPHNCTNSSYCFEGFAVFFLISCGFISTLTDWKDHDTWGAPCSILYQHVTPGVVLLNISTVNLEHELIGKELRSVGHTMLLHAVGGKRGGGGLTIVGVQQRQGAFSAPIHPSLRDNQRKKERRRGSECQKRRLSVFVRF